MRQSQVKPGVRAMLSLGRRGAVAVEVRYLKSAPFAAYRDGKVCKVALWACEDSSGRYHIASARQLRPLPAPVAATPAERAHVAQFAAAEARLRAGA